MSRGAKAIIDLNALQHNYQVAQSTAKSSQLIPIIKANAYGHGAIEVAQALSSASLFGVAALEEALELRQAGIAQPILLLEGFFHPSEIEEVIANNCLMVLHSLQQIEQLLSYAIESPLHVWIKLDTGMNRLGLLPEELPLAVARLQSNKLITIDVLASHLACADDLHNLYTPRQLEILKASNQAYSFALSMANSAGILAWPDSHFQWVRPGIMLYGANPFIHGSAEEYQLKPVMQLTAKIIALHQRKQGEAIGYGNTWVCPESMPVGVVGIGYGDGYPRIVPHGTPTWINGKEAMIIGRVSMDMLCVDLRGHNQVQIGDTVQLWGDKIAVDQVARAAQTIAYELTCGISKRVQYEYRQGD